MNSLGLVRSLTRLTTPVLACAGLLGATACTPPRKVESVFDRAFGKADAIKKGCEKARADWQARKKDVQEESSYPHVGVGFTQGLAFHQKVLFESTGPAGGGGLRRILHPDSPPGARHDTNALLFRKFVPNNLPVFPEGVASDGTEIFQLTLNHGFARVWDPVTMVEKRRVLVRGEGWGLCYDGERFIRSDGTATLHYHKRETFQKDTVAGKETLSVTLGGQPLPELNELECTKGNIYANVWFTNQIVRIDPATGEVTHVFDATELARKHPIEGADETDNVLNGIAHESKSFFITGKRWDKLYKVKLDPALEDAQHVAAPGDLPTCAPPAPPAPPTAIAAPSAALTAPAATAPPPPAAQPPVDPESK